MRRNSSNSTHYIKGLDGLRAVAVLMVLGYHLFPSLFPGGYLGVDIFFVISGFLITSLLITERARTGSIRLRKFWARRVRRLLPALLAVISITCAIALFVRGDVLVGIGRQILGALSFSNNWIEIAAGANYFDSTAAHLFTNFWSLAVEEQFYVIWPLAVIVLVGVPWFAQRSRLAIAVSCSIAIISAALMAVLFDTTNGTRVYYGTDTHLFGLMIGAALAFWNRSKARQYALRRLNQPFWWLAHKKRVQVIGNLALVGLVALMLAMPDTSAVAYYGGLVFTSILAGVVIVATTSKRGALQQLFAWRPLVWTGVRSYGIYLWHWPLLVLFGYMLPSSLDQWAVSTLVLAISFACAAASYRFIEIPIQRGGFRVILGRSTQRVADAGDARLRWRFQPYVGTATCLLVISLAVGAVISAPSKTQAQLRVEAGQRAINHAQAMSKNQSVAGAATSPLQLKPVVTGSDMTVIGDSVTLAAAPVLQARFPGILIDAEISRSMRRGGLETIENLNATGSLRNVVVVALATNGYFGADNLDKVVAELGNRRVVFVTAHVDREWTASNNDDLHKLAQRYRNVAIAEWDTAISPHAEDLGPDGIHPTAQGAILYADSLAQALGQ